MVKIPVGWVKHIVKDTYGVLKAHVYCGEYHGLDKTRQELHNSLRMAVSEHGEPIYAIIIHCALMVPNTGWTSTRNVLPHICAVIFLPRVIIMAHLPSIYILSLL